MEEAWVRDRRPVRRVMANEYAERGRWPATIPAVAQILDEGMELAQGVTVLIGENGTGKSTIVEAVAMEFGLSPEGGSAHARHSTRASESDLWRWIRLERSPGAPRWGFFLRAETMHGFYSYLEEHPGPHDPRFHELSHGESFLEILRTRFDSPGLYCLDEPEAAMSFSAQLALEASPGLRKSETPEPRFRWAHTAHGSGPWQPQMQPPVASRMPCSTRRPSTKPNRPFRAFSAGPNSTMSARRPPLNRQSLDAQPSQTQSSNTSASSSCRPESAEPNSSHSVA